MKKKKILNKISFLLFCISLFLGFKINEVKQFVTLPMISSWIPFENWFNFNDTKTSNYNEYFHLIENYYTNGSNSCNSIHDGLIMEVNEDSIQVLSDNGIVIVYGNLDTVLSKVDERVLKGQILGGFSDSLTINFSKDNQELTYEEVMKF